MSPARMRRYSSRPMSRVWIRDQGKCHVIDKDQCATARRKITPVVTPQGGQRRARSRRCVVGKFAIAPLPTIGASTGELAHPTEPPFPLAWSSRSNPWLEGNNLWLEHHHFGKPVSAVMDHNAMAIRGGDRRARSAASRQLLLVGAKVLLFVACAAYVTFGQRSRRVRDFVPTLHPLVPDTVSAACESFRSRRIGSSAG